MYEGLPPKFYPLIWFETKTAVTEDLASNIKLMINGEIFVYALAGIAIALGSIMIATVWGKLHIKYNCYFSEYINKFCNRMNTRREI